MSKNLHLILFSWEQCLYFWRDAHKEHLRDLASQLLTKEGLSKSWLDIVLGSADRISRYVNPDVRAENDHMDIRKYVKFKKVWEMNYLQLSHFFFCFLCWEKVSFSSVTKDLPVCIILGSLSLSLKIKNNT